MRRLLRSETFIALRARRKGYQIASEILNPHLVAPISPQVRLDVESSDLIPPLPPTPPKEVRVPWYRRMSRGEWFWFYFVITATILLFAFLWLKIVIR